MLAGGELCACKILEHFNITQPTLSYQMKILCSSGLVEGVRDGVWMRYSLNKKNIEALRDLFTEIDFAIEQCSKLDNGCLGDER